MSAGSHSAQVYNIAGREISIMVDDNGIVRVAGATMVFAIQPMENGRLALDAKRHGNSGDAIVVSTEFGKGTVDVVMRRTGGPWTSPGEEPHMLAILNPDTRPEVISFRAHQAPAPVPLFEEPSMASVG